MDYDTAIDYRLISLNNNWSFTFIWKNGTSSIATAFAHSLKTFNNYDHQIHTLFDKDNPIHMVHKDSSDYHDLVSSGSYNFVCLRDPLERFMSAFNDKIVRHPNGKESVAFFNINSKYRELSAIKQLKLFVDFVCEGENIDPHFISQTKIADLNSIEYDYIVRLNNLNNDWEVVANKFSDIPKLSKIKYWKNNSEDFIKEVKKEKDFNRLVYKIKDIYSDDYMFIDKYGIDLG